MGGGGGEEKVIRIQTNMQIDTEQLQGNKIEKPQQQQKSKTKRGTNTELFLFF